VDRKWSLFLLFVVGYLFMIMPTPDLLLVSDVAYALFKTDQLGDSLKEVFGTIGFLAMAYSGCILIWIHFKRK
jgi:hypothetical protein